MIRVVLVVAVVACSGGAPATTTGPGPGPISNQAEVTPDAAPPDADRRDALKQRYAIGKRAFDSGDYGTAALEFEAIYAEMPKAAILYNIAVARKLNRDFGKALAAFRALLADPDIDAAMRTEVENAVKDLEANNPPGQNTP